MVFLQRKMKKKNIRGHLIIFKLKVFISSQGKQKTRSIFIVAGCKKIFLRGNKIDKTFR